MKGFTLIELLAVIVILAVILLISIPLINGVIEGVKKSGFESSVKMIIKSADYDFLTSSSNFQNGGSITYRGGEAQGNDLPYSGQRPESGVINISSSGDIELALYDGTYCATKSYGSKDINVVKSTEEACVITSNPTFAKATSWKGMSFLIDSKSDLYVSYPKSNPIEISTNSSGEYPYEDAMLLADLVAGSLEKGAHYDVYLNLPTTEAELNDFVSTVEYKKTVYLLYAYGYFEARWNFRKIYTVDSFIDNEIVNNQEFIAFFNQITSEFLDFSKLQMTPENISDLIYNMYLFYISEYPIPYIEYLQSTLPAFAHAAYFYNDNEINALTMIYRAFTNEISDIFVNELVNDTDAMNYMMNLYDMLTDEELFDLPPGISNEKLLTYYYADFYLSSVNNEVDLNNEVSSFDFKYYSYLVYKYGITFDYFILDWNQVDYSESDLDNFLSTDTEFLNFYNKFVSDFKTNSKFLPTPDNMVEFLKYYYLFDFIRIKNSQYTAFDYLFLDYDYLIYTGYNNQENEYWVLSNYYENPYNAYELYDTDQNFKIYVDEIISKMNTAGLKFTGDEPVVITDEYIKSLAQTFFYYGEGFNRKSELLSYVEDENDDYLEKVCSLYYDSSYLENPSRYFDSCPLWDTREEIMAFEGFSDFFTKFTNEYTKVLDDTEIDAETIKTNLTDVKDIFYDDYRAYFLTNNGDVYYYDRGDLMEPILPSSTSIEKINGVSNVSKIFAYNNYIYFLKTDKTVAVMGDSSYTSLGLGKEVDALTPTLIPGLTDVVDITNEYDAIYATISDGTIKMWGNFGLPKGYYSTADYIIVATPTVMPNISDVKKIQAKKLIGNSIITYYVLHNDNTVSKFVKNSNYLKNQAFTYLHSISSVYLDIEVSDIKDNGSMILFNSNNTYYGLGSNTNNSLMDVYSPNYEESYTPMKSAIPTTATTWTNGRVLLYLNNGSLYYSGYFYDLFNMKYDYISEYDYSYILTPKKVPIDNIKSFSVYIDDEVSKFQFWVTVIDQNNNAKIYAINYENNKGM